MHANYLIKWMTALVGYGTHGYGKQTFILFYDMQQLARRGKIFATAMFGVILTSPLGVWNCNT